jgi:hypothetical protein
VFGSRSREDQPAKSHGTPDLHKQERDPEAPKGRPTPKRSEAQSQRRALATPTNKKEAAQRARATRKTALAKQREALASGDEKYLPARDKGPVRRLARDYVDSRWCVAEFFLPFAVLILLTSIVRSAAAQSISLLLWLAFAVFVIVDSYLITRRLGKLLRERYPDESHRGAKAYAIMRTLQLRRMRLPKPQVKRGQRP